MPWPNQRTRVLIYWSVPLPLFVSLFLLGHVWIALAAIAVILFAASLEMCPRCGGTLLTFGARRDEKGKFICHRCAAGRDGSFG